MGEIFFSDYVTYVVKTASNRLFERMAKIAAGGGYLTHSIFGAVFLKYSLDQEKY